MRLFKSLGARVSWPDLADEMGLERESDAVPASCPCPACGGRAATVYKNTTEGGHWHHCGGCGFRGDMVETAASHWGVGVPAALRALSDSGFNVPEDAAAVSAYVSEIVERRARFYAYWEASKARLIESRSPVVDKLRQKFRLCGRLSPGRFASGPGSMFGASSWQEAQLLYETINGGSKMFRGGGWGDVLVLPYYGAPGLPAGFMFVGRDGGPGDRVYRAAGRIGSRQREAGLFGVDTLETADAEFLPHVLAVEDPLLALRLQTRHAATSARPLPVVSWCDDGRGNRTSDSWSAVGRRRPVFWGFEATPGLVFQAIQSDGLLSIVDLEDPNRDSVDHYVRLGPPADLLRRAFRTAMPWRDLLASWAAGPRLSQVVKLVSALEGYGVDVGRLATSIGVRVEAATSARGVREARVGATRFVESDKGWFTLGPSGRSLFSEAVVRLDTVFGGGEPYYEGRILFNGHEVPFLEPASKLEGPHARGFVARLCVAAGVGRPAFGFGNVGVVSIAVAFQRPKSVVPC